MHRFEEFFPRRVIAQRGLSKHLFMPHLGMHASSATLVKEGFCAPTGKGLTIYMAAACPKGGEPSIAWGPFAGVLMAQGFGLRGCLRRRRFWVGGGVCGIWVLTVPRFKNRKANTRRSTRAFLACSSVYHAPEARRPSTFLLCFERYHIPEWVMAWTVFPKGWSCQCWVCRHETPDYPIKVVQSLEAVL